MTAGGEAVSQCWPGAAGANRCECVAVSASLAEPLGNAHVRQLRGACVCTCVYPNGWVVGLISEGGSPAPLPVFSVRLSALQLLRVSLLQCRFNSAPKGEGIRVLVQTWPREQQEVRAPVLNSGVTLYCTPPFKSHL